MDALAGSPSARRLPPHARDALLAYVRLLADWRGANVTGVRDADAIVATLIQDALALLDVPEVVAAEARSGPWLDLGSGAGIPGVPLALALPKVSMVLLESVRRKCVFLREAVEVAGLEERARVICERSETYAAGPPGREVHAAVFARAVGSLPMTVELAAPLLSPDGWLIVSTSSSRADEQSEQVAATAGACGMSPRHVRALSASPLEDSVAVLLQRSSDLPPGLPRRPGRARRRPLGL